MKFLNLAVLIFASITTSNFAFAAVDADLPALDSAKELVISSDVRLYAYPSDDKATSFISNSNGTACRLDFYAVSGKLSELLQPLPKDINSPYAGPADAFSVKETITTVVTQANSQIDKVDVCTKKDIFDCEKPNAVGKRRATTLVSEDAAGNRWELYCSTDHVALKKADPALTNENVKVQGLSLQF